MINPYQPLESASSARATSPELSRAILAQLLRQVLDGKITDPEFTHRLHSFQLGADPVLPIVIDQLFDLCSAEPLSQERDGRTGIKLSRNDWNYLQRLLLLLEADCQLETRSQRYWSTMQLVAAAFMTMVAIVTALWGWHGLAWAWLPCGLVSMAIEWVMSRRPSGRSAYQSIIEPFASIGDLRTAYESTQFAKQKYQGPPPSSPRLGWFAEAMAYLLLGVFWLALGPAILAIQIAPRTAVTIQARPHPPDASPNERSVSNSD